MRAHIFANYGVLGNEYRTVYTIAPHCHAKVSEQITVDIPSEFHPRRNDAGEIVIDIPGMPWAYTLQEAIGTIDGFPAICWYDGAKNHRQMLRVIDGADQLV